MKIIALYGHAQCGKSTTLNYLCDVFRRIKKTAKEQLVNLVAHRWSLLSTKSTPKS